MLEKLYLHHFRNYEEKRLDFFSSQILICGQNGIGKTNILEAIHFLGIMRSFKNASVRELILDGEDEFTLMAQFSRNGMSRKINVQQKKNGERTVCINDIPERRADVLLHSFRPVIFAPEDRMLISGTAAIRRRFFDILISLENSSYLSDLQQYKHALAQRNALLKKRDMSMKNAIFAPFEELLAFHGERLMQLRQQYALLLEAEVNKLADNDEFRIQYRPDWKTPEMNMIRQSLERNRSRDIQKGFTGEGVQLDDFDMFLNGFAMRSFASSGQIRIYSLFLKMAEFNLSCGKGEMPIALVDDVTGELDEINKQKFFILLERAEQVFFTFTEPQNISENQQLIEL